MVIVVVDEDLCAARVAPGVGERDRAPHVPVWMEDVPLVAEEALGVPLALPRRVPVQSELHDEARQHSEECAPVEEAAGHELAEALRSVRPHKLRPQRR